MDHVRRLANEKGLAERYGLPAATLLDDVVAHIWGLPPRDVAAGVDVKGLRASAMGTAPKIAHIRGAKAPREE